VKNFMAVRLVALVSCATAIAGQKIKVESLANPSGPTSLQAHWSMKFDGKPDLSPLLSWIELSKDGSSKLMYAARHGGQWSQPRMIVANRRFFRQPAESPSVVSFEDGTLLAEWVEVPEKESDAEYIFVSASKNGLQWTPPVMAHQDRSPVQHALVSMVVSGGREASLIWLEALQGEDAPAVLKRTVVSSDGKIVKEESLDRDVCTCCPTSVVKTARGLLVAYRDHTPANIRDIAVIRLENGRWLPSRTLHPDKWEINACPVNGASVAATANRVAIAWFTEADDDARTQVILSSDGGANFGKSIRVSEGNSFGHVSIAFDENAGTVVSWLEEGESGYGARLMVRAVTNAGVAGPPVKVAEGSLAAIGYPRLLHAGRETWIAWGNSGTAKIQTARLLE
jgi:hypothetical protein